MSNNIFIDTSYRNQKTEQQTFSIERITVNSDEELFILNVYEFMKNKKIIKINNQEIVGISLLKASMNEILGFEKAEHLLNQFRLHLIEEIINRNYLVESFPDVLTKNKRKKDFPITAGLSGFYQKNKKHINNALVQQSIHTFLAYYSFENSINFDEYDIVGLIEDIKKTL